MSIWLNPHLTLSAIGLRSPTVVETGAASDPVLLATIKPGWNVWAVWQAENLSFSPMLLGVSRDRQLRLWVEEQAERAGANVADPLALKGTMVEILNGAPAGLAIVARKEQLPSFPSFPADKRAELRFVRFFDRRATDAKPVNLSWPSDDDYLLDAIYRPDASAPVTATEAPSTILGGAAQQAGVAAAKGAEIAKDLALIGVAAVGLYLVAKAAT